MSENSNKQTGSDGQLERMRANMLRLKGIYERVAKGEATAEEVAEVEALKEKVKRTPEGILGGG